ncbi:MAG TPA: MerC family mercury resistance protein [Gemmatimonas sp.]|nr:MerC family mercury resistance protein [Gemmatimonas sp.]
MHQDRRIDTAGAVASVACALHCVAPAVLVAVAPAATAGFDEQPLLEWGLLALTLILATASLWRARRRGVNVRGAALLFGGGFSGALAGRMGEGQLHDFMALGTILTGGVLVAAGHILLRHRRLAMACCDAGCDRP